MMMTDLERAGWHINTWREAAGGLSRGFVYKLIRRGEVKTTKVGTRRVILTPPREFLDKCRREVVQDEG